MPQHTLSDQDVKTLRELLTSYSSGRLNTANRPKVNDWEDSLMPEVYAAKTPGGGIPAISGTTPGSAVCDIYQLIDGSVVLASGTLPYPVYNLSSSSVAGGTYALVHRDKYGTWFTQPVGAGGGGGTTLSELGINTTVPPATPQNTTLQTGITKLKPNLNSGMWVSNVGDGVTTFDSGGNLLAVGEQEWSNVGADVISGVAYNGVVLVTNQAWQGAKKIVQSAVNVADKYCAFSEAGVSGTWLGGTMILSNNLGNPYLEMDDNVGQEAAIGTAVPNLGLGVLVVNLNNDFITVTAGDGNAIGSGLGAGGPGGAGVFTDPDVLLTPFYSETNNIGQVCSGWVVRALSSVVFRALAVDGEVRPGQTGIGITGVVSVGSGNTIDVAGGLVVNASQLDTGGASQFDIPGNLLNGLIS